MKRVGLLGGSFNPAHRGHRQLSLAALEALGLDELWWLVSPGNPLKDSAGMAPFHARFASAVEMARGTPIRASDFEVRAGTRFTVDTIERMIAECPDHRFIWLMGLDILPEFHRWKDWREVAGSLPIAVLPRPGYDEAAQAARAMGWLRRFVRPCGQARNWAEWSPPAIVFLRLPTDATSATALRALDPDWHRSMPSPTDGETPDPRSRIARPSK